MFKRDELKKIVIFFISLALDHPNHKCQIQKNEDTSFDAGNGFRSFSNIDKYGYEKPGGKQQNELHIKGNVKWNGLDYGT